MIYPLIIFGKIIAYLSRLFHLGSGGTWPGEIALKINPKILTYFLSRIKKGLILISGTNGKTTTAKMLFVILGGFENNPEKIVRNQTGANLLNGLISAFIEKSNWLGRQNTDYAIFEVDEAVFPIILSYLPNFRKKLIIILLNLFRDQLDRYGEVDLIAGKWQKGLEKIPKNTTLILNADDPQIAYLGEKRNCTVDYIGIEKKEKYLEKREHATDSIFCRHCGHKLKYDGIYFSHLGIWQCIYCGNKRPNVSFSLPRFPILGLYNEYNALSAGAAAHKLGCSKNKIVDLLSNFQPAFGRQEEFIFDGKKIKIFLSKNPAGFNASLRAVLELKPKVMLFVLNDRIPDGRDISWIWDVDFEMIQNSVSVVVSGDRVYDMGLRIKYTYKTQNSKLKTQNHNAKLRIIKSLRLAIDDGLSKINRGETLYILPTYSAMLEVRKILIGRKIL